MSDKRPIATNVYCDGVCPAVIVWTEADGVQYSWHSIYADKIIGGCVLCSGVAVEDENNTLYLRRPNGKWCSDVSPIGVPDEIAAHLDLVEEMAAAYRLNHFDRPQ